ncbi:hypothetical protein ACV357_34240, partial [Pseudomonas aeruginosa]
VTPEQVRFGAREERALLVRHHSPRVRRRWIGIGLVLLAGGQPVLLPGQLKELVKLVCSGDALYLETLDQCLAKVLQMQRIG